MQAISNLRKSEKIQQNRLTRNNVLDTSLALVRAFAKRNVSILPRERQAYAPPRPHHSWQLPQERPMRGRSSVWLERWPVKPEVEGSNPFGPAIFHHSNH